MIYWSIVIGGGEGSGRGGGGRLGGYIVAQEKELLSSPAVLGLLVDNAESSVMPGARVTAVAVGGVPGCVFLPFKRKYPVLLPYRRRTSSQQQAAKGYCQKKQYAVR